MTPEVPEFSCAKAEKRSPQDLGQESVQAVEKLWTSFVLDRCNGWKSSNDAASGSVQLATMVAQQAVAKRSVGRRVTLLDAPFF
jgi:hypothetical protein